MSSSASLGKSEPGWGGFSSIPSARDNPGRKSRINQGLLDGDEDKWRRCSLRWSLAARSNRGGHREFLRGGVHETGGSGKRSRRVLERKEESPTPPRASAAAQFVSGREKVRSGRKCLRLSGKQRDTVKRLRAKTTAMGDRHRF